MVDSSLKIRIRQFFRERNVSDSAEINPSKLRKVLTGFEGLFRAQAGDQLECTVEGMGIATLSFPELRCDVYVVAALMKGQAILAVYDNAILWLDHYVNNEDFSSFIKRENLIAWIPDRWEKIIQLFVATKFAFLFRPQLIRSASDIPRYPEDQLDGLGTQQVQTMREVLQEDEQRIAEITQQITPPTLQIGTDGRIYLTFFVWTKIMGLVFKLECMFGENLSFDYDGERLTVDPIGHYLRW